MAPAVRKVGQRVPIEEAKRRALAYLGKHFGTRHLCRPCEVGRAIWPDARNTMRPQGLGLAAVRILKLLEEDKLSRWECRSDGMRRTVGGWTSSSNWGWIATSRGMEVLRERPH